MKRCPECMRDYYDDSLSYCLDDGSVLLEGPSSNPSFTVEPATAVMPNTVNLRSIRKLPSTRVTHRNILICRSLDNFRLRNTLLRGPSSWLYAVSFNLTKRMQQEKDLARFCQKVSRPRRSGKTPALRHPCGSRARADSARSGQPVSKRRGDEIDIARFS